MYDPDYLDRLLALPTPQYLGATPWLLATQFEADAFAEVSGGRVPWSNDPGFCGKHLQSAPVVHGMYPLAFASWAANEVEIIPDGERQEPFGTGVAYGFDSVRWYEDLPIGSRFRIHVSLEDVQSKGPDRYLFSVAQEIERENSPFVAVSFIWKFLIFTAEP
jgi:acyl dehydratase